MFYTFFFVKLIVFVKNAK